MDEDFIAVLECGVLVVRILNDEEAEPTCHAKRAAFKREPHHGLSGQDV